VRLEGMDGALQVGGPRPLRGLFSIRTEDVAMPNRVEQTDETEPMGIVISRGNRDEPTPAVFMYVWGIAPEAETESKRMATPRAA
jgi:hypothetical protein